MKTLIKPTIADTSMPKSKVKNRCTDYDKDCLTIHNYEHCHAHDPSTGNCPFINRKN